MSKTKKARPKAKKVLIHGDLLIGDVLNQLPEAAEIMQDFGLHCTSCSVNVFEPLKLGAMSHGITEEVVDEMIEKINDLALARRRAPDDGIYVTGKAARKIQEFAKAEEKEGWGLRVTAADKQGREPAYAMDFQNKVEKGQKAFEFHGVEIFLDTESLRNLAGAEVDFVESAYGSGFKITNPRFIGKRKACACGGGGCGGNEDESCGCGARDC